MDKGLILKVCAVLGGYGLIPAVCNCLASYGIRIWRRVFLLPYLAFLFIVLGMLFIYLIRVFILYRISEYLVLPVIVILIVGLIWQKLFKQWFMMSKPRVAGSPLTQQEVESQALALAAAMAILHMSQSGPTVTGNSLDLPPTYEDLEVDITAPPGYEEAIHVQACEEVGHVDVI